MHEKLPKILANMIANERKRRGEITRVKIRNALEDVPVGHGRRLTITNQVCAGELRWRSVRWFEIARRLAAKTRMPWTEETSATISGLLEVELATDREELEAIPSNGPRAGASGRTEAMDEALDYSITRIRAETELLALAQEVARIPLDDLLRSPRYNAIRRAWERANNSFAANSGEDFKPAVLEAVAAVEQLGRLVIGNNTATLGDVIRELRRRDMVAPPVLKGIEELWGWASNEPGVRHGASARAVVVEATEARYALGLAKAALELLIELDL